MASEIIPHQVASRLVLLSRTAGITAVVVAAYSVLFPDIYRPFTPNHIMAGAMSQDISTVACVFLVLSMLRCAEANPKAWLIWAGAFGYLWYGYALYSFGSLYTFLYPAYLAIFSLASFALLFFAFAVDLQAVSLTRNARLLRRLVAGNFIFIILVFVILFMGQIIAAIEAKQAPEESTIFVLDLTMVLPLLGVAASALWQDRPWGDLIALPLLIKASTIGLSVLLGTLLQPLVGLPVAYDEVPIYGFLGCLPLVIAIPFWRSLKLKSA